MNIVEGTEVVTVGRYGSKCANFKSGGCRFSLPVWIGKTYVAKKNKKGELVWVLSSSFGRSVASRNPSKKLIEEVEASHENYLPYVSHGQKIKVDPT